MLQDLTTQNYIKALVSKGQGIYTAKHLLSIDMLECLSAAVHPNNFAAA